MSIQSVMNPIASEKLDSPQSITNDSGRYCKQATSLSYSPLWIPAGDSNDQRPQR